MNIFHQAILISATFMFLGCGHPTSKITPSGGSTTSAVDLKLPDRDKMPGGSKLTGYALKVQPTDTKCSGSKIDTINSWSNNKLDVSVKKGCDYRVVLYVGQLSGKNLNAYFSNENATDNIITKKELESGRAEANVKLVVTKAGEAEGFGSQPSQEPTSETATTDLEINVDLQNPEQKTWPSPHTFDMALTNDSTCMKSDHLKSLFDDSFDKQRTEWEAIYRQQSCEAARIDALLPVIFFSSSSDDTYCWQYGRYSFTKIYRELVFKACGLPNEA